MLSLRDSVAIEEQVAAHFGVALAVGVASARTRGDDDHTVGRRALVGAQRGAGRGPLAGVVFPSPTVSVTHAGGFGVAVAAPAASAATAGRGLGVDFEPAGRLVSERAGRLYLTESERAHVEALATERRSSERLRLWVVKEAAYKATPANHAHTVAAYRLHHPAETAGAASCTATGDRIDYLSLRVVEGWLAVAVCSLARGMEGGLDVAV